MNKGNSLDAIVSDSYRMMGCPPREKKDTIKPRLGWARRRTGVMRG